MDSIQMIVISGQVPSHAIGEDAPGCDTVGITSLMKHNFLVKDVRQLAETVKSLLYRDDRASGPVLIDIPKDISNQKTTYHYPKEIEMRIIAQSIRGMLAKFAKRFN